MFICILVFSIASLAIADPIVEKRLQLHYLKAEGAKQLVLHVLGNQNALEISADEKTNTLKLHGASLEVRLVQEILSIIDIPLSQFGLSTF